MLKISTRCRYGLLAMVELGQCYGQAPVSAQEIYKKQRVPKFYLQQLLVKLRRNGLVESIRGTRGGFVLKKDPKTIKILDIVKAVEGPVQLISCTKQSRDKCCSKIKECLTRPVWVELHEVVNRVLSERTLHDLMR
ncbi:MAG: RrF2 family transcriptional regulator [bacterium]|nr:RrF2 family transcriptional regulator [bacterium]MDD5353661.1 RrF2 family transcriptional regulator [bacterium]MDD5756492.1 RrF2 family transcriptional regulator [bacterium]